VPSRTFNTFSGFPVKPKSEPLDDMIVSHIRDVMCDKDAEAFNYVMNWLAHLIQKPLDKVGVCLVFISEQGAGKNTIWDWIRAKIFGNKYSHMLTDLDSLTAAFNKRMESKMLCVLNEIGNYGGNYKSNDKLKSVLTDTTIYIQPKGLEAYEISDYCRYVMLTNSDWAARIETSDRRYAVFGCSNSKIGDCKYFDTLHNKLTDTQADAFVDHL
jgi:hypothetical protein